MAAIDKIYVNSWNEYQLFKEWCETQPTIKDKYGKDSKIIDYFFYQWNNQKYWNEKDCHPVMSAPFYIDAYIIRNCPFDFVQKALMINYYGSYELIKEGKLYDKPYIEKYERGKHFTMVKMPDFYNGNVCQRPIRGCWMIDVKLPDYVDELYMVWHSHSKTRFSVGTWDFACEFVDSIDGWSSSATYCRTIDALKRRIPKWNLPVGTIVRAIGRYIGEEYEFIVKK